MRQSRFVAADAVEDAELARLKLLESVSDPTTFRCLDAVGAGPGWRCLEVGAGAGSVTRWLADRVGPTGYVVVIEDPDYGTVEALDPQHPLAAAFDTCYRARNTFLLEAKVMDLRCGHALPRQMDALGLVDTGNEAVTRFERGGSVLSRFWLETWRLTDDAMVAAGAVTQDVATDCACALEDPTFAYRGALICSLWGRKPLNG